MREPAAAPIDADRQLRRVIGPWGVGINAVNSSIGGGIFVLPGIIAAILGPAAIVCYLICGLAIGLVLTCFAEIGSFVHRSGGPIAYTEEAFGPLAGFLAWTLYTIGCEAGSCAAISNILVDMLAQIAPPLAHGAPRILAFFVLYAGLAAINIRGIQQGVRLSVISTLAKLLPMFLLIAVGIFFMHWREFHWTGWPSAAKLGEGSLLIFYAFQGPEEALCTSAEIRNPARTVPRGILGAIAALILLYVALQTVCMGVLGSSLALDSTAPLANAAAHVAGSPGRSLILIGAAISIFGSIAASVMAAPRSFFLMQKTASCLAHSRASIPASTRLTSPSPPSPQSPSRSPSPERSATSPSSPPHPSCACISLSASVRSSSATPARKSPARSARPAVPPLESSAAPRSSGCSAPADVQNSSPSPAPSASARSTSSSADACCCANPSSRPKY